MRASDKSFYLIFSLDQFRSLVFRVFVYIEVYIVGVYVLKYVKYKRLIWRRQKLGIFRITYQSIFIMSNCLLL